MSTQSVTSTLNTVLPSTVTGLGQIYVSTFSLTSTVAGLGQRYLSTVPLNLSTNNLIASTLSTFATASIGGDVWIGGTQNASWYPRRWICGANGTDNSGTIYYSDNNGISWNHVPGSKENIFTTRGSKAIWNGSMWVMNGVGSKSRLAYSTNGINWTDCSNATDASGSTTLFTTGCYDVAWNGRMWVACGKGNYSVDNSGAICYSSDGITWRRASGIGALTVGETSTKVLDPLIRCLKWNGYMWLAGINVGIGTASAGEHNNVSLLYSYDGINWAKVSTSAQTFNQSCISIEWNGILWVMVGYDDRAAGIRRSVYYSYNGFDWAYTPVNVFEEYGDSIKWNGTMFVATGWRVVVDTDTIAYSYDGINWITSRTFFTSSSARTYGIGWNGNKWIICGSGPLNQTMITSTDGINWSYVTNNISGIALNPSYSIDPEPDLRMTNFNIYSQNVPNYLTSSNQIFVDASTIRLNNIVSINKNSGNTYVNGCLAIGTITASTLAGPATLLDVNGNVNINSYQRSANSPKIWVAGGSGTNTIATSPNGITWTARVNTVFTTECKGLAWNGSLWVALGSGSNTIGYSRDGFNWTGLGTGIFDLEGRRVAWNGSLWIAVGSGTSNRIATSPNGITWSSSTSGNSVLDLEGYDIAWNGSLWVAVGRGTAHTIATSPDGITWTGRGKSIISTSARGIAWNGLLWVAVGTGTNTIATSPDGITWTGRGDPFISGIGYGVAWNGSLWVAVGTGTNTIVSSPDGITWTARTNTLNAYGSSVEWNGSVWVATGGGTNTLATSPDGITWTGRGDPFGSGGNAIAYSTDPNPDLRMTNFNVYSQNVPNYLTSSNQILVGTSSITLNSIMTINKDSKSTIIGVNTYINGDLRITGTAYGPNASWNTTSDQRAKTNISIIDPYICLSSIRTLPLKSYSYSADYRAYLGNVPEKTYTGFIAQEVEKIFPNAVQQINDYGYSDFRSLNYHEIQMAHYGATQYLANIQDEQQSTIKGQSAEIAELRRMIQECMK